MNFKYQLELLAVGFNRSFSFVASRLKHFPQLSLGEQISYPVIGVGLILVIISIIMFII